MLANLIIIGGVITVVTGLLDLFLSDQQKATLSDWSLKVWNWVDEAKSLAIFERFMRPEWQLRVSILSWIVSVLYSVYAVLELSRGFVRGYGIASESDYDVVFGFAAITAIIMGLGSYADWKFSTRTFHYLSSSRTIFGYIGRTTILTLIPAVITASLLGGFVIIAKTWFDDIIQSGVLFFPTMSLALAGFFFTPILFKYLMMWLFGWGIATLILLAYLVLYPVELILRRIAEAPTGPVVAIGALATAIGTLAEVFSP
jgi:hypothetical protein